MPLRTLILIPAYNEEAALPGVLRDLIARHAAQDILVVDDGSADNTSAVAREMGVTVATLPFNLGIGGALRTGFRFAARFSYDRVVQFDADGQHDAAEIPALLEGLDRGADMVIGSRFATEDGEYHVSTVRGGAMQLLRVVVGLLSGSRFTDTSSGFRGFSRRAIDLFARRYPVEYMDSVEALILAAYDGLEVVEVPTRMHQRTAGTPSNRSFKLAYHYLRLLTVLVLTASLRGRRQREVMM